ncbi:hypothetical protein BDZ45DRAFT_745660 [Acephala macrosclerotiorum]|nr:hypothetical protein BDZ45DRAFT_745660 [Acephala macrosclerotiorum]
MLEKQCILLCLFFYLRRDCSIYGIPGAPYETYIVSSSAPAHSTRDLASRTTLLATHYIDDLTGFSTALLPIFDEINNLTNITNISRQSPAPVEGSDFASFNQEACEILVDKGEEMVSNREPKFAPCIQGVLSPIAQFDFFILDEAYHYMALLQLHCRTSGFFCQKRIQRSVNAILACIKSMSFVDGPCPGAVVLPPLFTAGCHASNTDDRQSIMSLPHKSEMFFGMGNVKSASKTLKRLWTTRDCLVQEEGENNSKKWQDIIGYFLTPQSQC